MITDTSQIRWLAVGFMITWLAGCVGHGPTGKTQLRVPSVTHNTDTQHCLSLVMYWEARGEGHQGMRAVGSVVLNRVHSNDFPNTICEVVYEGGETPPCQFSWWCDGKSDRPRNRTQWRVALAAADDLLFNRSHDLTGGALFFHSTAVRSSWHRTRQRTAKIGNHIFYR